MSYKYLLFFEWLKARLKDGLWSIPISAGIALFVLFFGNVVFSTKVTYLFAWKWSYVSSFGISTLLSLIWYVARWKTDHMLAKKWNVEVEMVFDGLTKFKLLKTKKYDQIKNWSTEDFMRHYNVSRMVHHATKNLW